MPRPFPQGRIRILAAPKGDGPSANPYLRLLYDNMARQGAEVEQFSYARAWRERFDVVHLHWPERMVRGNNLLASLARHLRLAAVLRKQKRQGARIVWTCHNLEPHESDFRTSRWLFRTWLVRAITHCIALSPIAQTLAREKYPLLEGKVSAVIPHGHYRPIFPRRRAMETARRLLDLPAHARVFLCFGNIRPYKQAPLLVEEFKRLPVGHARLIVAGEPASAELGRQLARLAADDPRVLLRLGPVPDEEVPLLFGAADLAVCAFQDILNSGSTILALSLNRPVLAPRIGALPDLQALVGPAWLRLYDPPFSHESLFEGMSEDPPVDLEAGPDLSALDWDGIASATLQLYRKTRLERQ